MTKMVKKEVPNAIDYPKQDTFSYPYYVLNKCWKDFKDSGLFCNTCPVALCLMQVETHT